MKLKKNKLRFVLLITLSSLTWIAFFYVNLGLYKNIIVAFIGLLSVILFAGLYCSTLKSFHIRTCSFGFARTLLFNLKWGFNYQESLEISNEKIKDEKINISLEDTSLSLEFKKLKLGYLNSLITTIIDSASNGKKLFIKSLSIDYLLRKEIDKQNDINSILIRILYSFFQVNFINTILFFMCVINQNFERIISNTIMYIWLIIIIANLLLTFILKIIKGEI